MKLKEYPEKIRPYVFHGVALEVDAISGKVSEMWAQGKCPFCGKEDHFHVSQDTGQYSCKRCSAKGNAYTFIAKLHEMSMGFTSDAAYQKLASQRKLSVEGLKEAGVCKSKLRPMDWLVPSYNMEGKIGNLSRWTVLEKGKKRQMLGTPGCVHHLFGLDAWDEDKGTAYIVEGIWDVIAMRDTLRIAKPKSDDANKLVKTKYPSRSLEASSNVVGTSSSVFKDGWVSLFDGKDTVVAYDNDAPDEESGVSAGWAGSERVIRMLASGQASSVEVLEWGPSGFDEAIEPGWDIRDQLTHNGSPVRSLQNMLERVVEPPKDWLEGNNGSAEKKNDLVPKHCEKFSEVRASWEKALRWTPGLDNTLAVMLATSGSTLLQGDQIWLRVIGPPGSAKTTLCEAMTVSETIVPISMQTGFHSGWRGGKGDGDEKGKSASLIPRIDRKTVIIKDGDTLLTSPNLSQTLAELRDIYDGVSRAIYRNKTEAAYSGLRITFIIAGTKSLSRLNRSFLGDRFLDCIIYDRERDANPELEKDILNRSASQALRRMRSAHDGTSDNLNEERMSDAMRLTAGYLEYLRDNCEDLINQIDFPMKMETLCTELGTAVAFLRARPDKEDEDEDQEVELATRLTSQFVRMTACLCMALNKKKPDKEVIKIVKKVARDTGRGLNYKIINNVLQTEGGMDVKSLASVTRKSETAVRTRLQFLREIGVMKTQSRNNNSGVRGRNRHYWIVTREAKRVFNKLKG